MRTVLILEGDPAVARLLELQVRRLEREPVIWTGGPVPDFDLALMEPAWPAAARFARRLFAERPHVPRVFVSVLEPNHDTMALEPAAHLVKPIRLAELERALSEGERQL